MAESHETIVKKTRGRKLMNNGTKMLHMEQKLDMEIVDALVKEKLHARALARKMKTNHMTVARRLKELASKNILDFAVEGRNNVYFIKKSLESRSYLMMSESYKLNKAIEKYPELRSIADAIQKNENIRLALLFGSYAKLAATKNSDIDIFVETDDRSIGHEIEALNSRLSVKTGTYDRSSLLIKEIEKNHVVIKGVELFYEKNQFFC